MKLVRNYESLVEQPELEEDKIRPVAGIVHVQSGEYHALVASKSAYNQMAKIKSRIKRNEYRKFNEINKVYRETGDLHVGVFKYCEEKNLRIELFATKQKFVAEGKHLLNPDIIQVRDTIVPPRYEKLIERLIMALKNFEITEKQLEAFINIPK